jgi:predicted amidohydrolase YtcJ
MADGRGRPTARDDSPGVAGALVPYASRGWRRADLTQPEIMTDLVLREVVVDGRLVDVRASGGVITEIDRRLPARPGDDEVDGRRGALIPGLHDHHVHLLALAAAEPSPVSADPPASPPAPDLAATGARLAGYGVTGVSDLTPTGSSSDLAVLAAAAGSGALPQRVMVGTGPGLAAARAPAPLTTGPVKLVVDDGAPPTLDTLVRWMRAARDAARPVAVHCVTRAGLALALDAWDRVGTRPGDRIEHGSVVPPDLRSIVAARHLTVVTQPGYVLERGDRYLASVAHADLPHLYPCRGLIEAGIPVGGGTDAPYGHPDPWRAIASAIERRTSGGRPLGVREAVSPERALALFLTPLDDPGGRPRRVELGAPADLCLLDGPLSQVLEGPSSDSVAATVIGGTVQHR